MSEGKKRLDESLSRSSLVKSETGMSEVDIDLSAISISSSGNIQPAPEKQQEEIKAEKEKTEEKIDDNIFLNEWAEKICQTMDKTWKGLTKLHSFCAEEEKKFLEEMDGKQFGKFITTFKPEKGSFIYLKVGDCEIGPHYSPSFIYKEKIKSFLERQENSLEIIQEIIMRLATIPIFARMIRGRILYPEIGEMEKKIADLEEKVKDKNEKLRMSLDMWNCLSNEINSSLTRANSLFYALLDESKKE